jgi:hypothetical protein
MEIQKNLVLTYQSRHLSGSTQNNSKKVFVYCGGLDAFLDEAMDGVSEVALDFARGKVHAFCA